MVPLIQGNSKKNKQPCSHIYLSVARDIEASPMKVSEVTATVHWWRGRERWPRLLASLCRVSRGS